MLLWGCIVGCLVCLSVVGFGLGIWNSYLVIKLSISGMLIICIGLFLGGLFLWILGVLFMLEVLLGCGWFRILLYISVFKKVRRLDDVFRYSWKDWIDRVLFSFFK